MNLVIHTDGGARGNPGPAAVGVVIEEKGEGGTLKSISRFGKRIGETTNNVAEYTAVIEALEHVATLSEEVTSIQFFLDSLLVVNQLNGLFKVKQSHLRELLTRVRMLEQGSGCNITYTAVPREQNASADFLVNQALDAG